MDLPELRAGDLVAVSLPPGPEWVHIVERVWEAGAALFPVDHRLPAAEAKRLLRVALPTVVLEANGVRRIEDGRPAEAGVALTVATSGTSGDPRLVQFDRKSLDSAVAASALALEATPQDRWLCALPLAHVGVLLVLLRAVLLGAPVAVHPAFDVEAFEAEPDVAFTALVATQLGRLLDAGADLGRFRAILVGGGPFPPGLRERAERAGARVVETYGLTESCGGVLYDGRPLPGTELRLGPHDEIQLRGPTLMLGYRADAGATRRAFTQDGWLRTDDAGELDAEGRLRVSGRLDDVILSGGEKIWPDEVELALRSHPKVAEIAVAGRPDAGWGTRVVAYVVPSGEPPTLEELRDHAGRTLPRYKAPQELVIVTELPRTALGKVRRAALG